MLDDWWAFRSPKAWLLDAWMGWSGWDTRVEPISEPPKRSLANLLKRTPRTIRRRDASYAVPCLIVDRNGIRSNPEWDRDRAWPVVEGVGN